MKRETNISINSQIEIGDYNGYYSGDLLDANATANLIEEKISDLALTYQNISGAPTNVSQFTNDANYITQTYFDNKLNDILGINAEGIGAIAAVIRDDSATTGLLQQIANKVNRASLHAVAFSGSYMDLTNKPTIPNKTSNLINDSNFISSTSLATVATSGNYNDLINKPSVPIVPTNVSAFTNDSGYAVAANLATVATSGSYSDLLNKPVAQVYYNFTSYDPTGETEYATGIVKLTGGVVHSKYEVEVLYQSAHEKWVGKKFYVSNTAVIGNTLYPLYDINDNEIGVSVKINSAVN